MSLLPSGFLQQTLWDEEKNPIWLGSSLSVMRNLLRYKFPPKLSEAEMTSCTRSLSEAFNVLPSMTYLPAEKLTPLDKELLFEHFLCVESFQNAAAGQGFVIDAPAQLLCL